MNDSDAGGSFAGACTPRWSLAARRIQALLAQYDIPLDLDDPLALENGLTQLEALAEQDRLARRTTQDRLQEHARHAMTCMYLVRHAPTAMVMMDREYRFAFANNTYATLQGVPVETILGQSLQDIISAEHFQTAAAQLEQVFQGETLEFSTWYTYPDGDRFMHVFYYPVCVNAEIVYAGVILTDITPQARTEEALRDSEERFYAFSEASTEGIVVHENGVILEANQAIADHLGYTRDELQGMPVLALTAPESHDEMIRRMISADPGPYTAVSLHRDGSKTIGELRARNFIYHGRPVRLVAMRDVTELQRVQEALEALLHNTEAWAAEMEAVISSIAEVVTVVDNDGNILRMNPVAEQMVRSIPGPYPRTLTELLTRSQVTTPEGQPLPGDAMVIGQVFQGEIVRGFLVVVKFPDGHTAWLSASGGPIRLTDGQQIGAVFTATDITALHELQEEAQRHAAELEATLSSIADGLIIYDNAGEVKRTNRAITTVAGIPQNALRLPHREMVTRLHMETPDGQPIPYEKMPHMRALRGERVVSELMVIHPEPKQAFWISSSAAPIRTPRGELLGAVLTINNITQMHLLQEERELYMHTVSHDLRAPLAVINGHAQLIQQYLHDHQLNGDLHVSVDAILRGVQRMNTMIQDLVDAARLEGGQMQLTLQPINLAEYLHDLLLRAETMMAVERLHIALPDDLPRALADFDRLERIFMNLISNALKYSPPEAPVEITACRSEAMLEVSVQDHGIGIAPEDISHLFDRFYRAHGAQQVEGIGLGLYITRKLVEAHGGQLRVASVVGQGSTFTFTLPTA